MTFTQIDASESMIERLTRRLCIAQGVIQTDNERARAREEVIAVLTALREPTPGMIEAGDEVSVRDFIPAGQHTTCVWQAMIDHMLNEEGE